MPAPRGGIVEFVGLPASGKTTLAVATAAALSERGLGRPTSSSDRRRRMGRIAATAAVAREAAGAPRRTLRVADAIAGSRQSRDRTAIGRFLYHHYLIAELEGERASGGIHLADQGFLQHLWRVHLTARADGDAYLRELAAAGPDVRPAVVVFVETDHRTRMERAVGRGQDIDEELFDPEHPAIRADHRAYEEFKAIVPSLYGDDGPSPTTIEVDNRRDALADNAERIAAVTMDALDGEATAPPQPAASD